MFDIIKVILGFCSCKGCIHRRLWGLRCGCKDKGVLLPKSAWQSYGCWHYVDKAKEPKK